MIEQRTNGGLYSVESSSPEDSISESDKSILIMLDNRCLSPCNYFGSDGRSAHSMLPQTLDKVIAWASQLKPKAPGILCMVGAPQSLHGKVQDILETVAPSVIWSPLDPSRQDKTGLPYAETQAVVFPSLMGFKENYEGDQRVGGVKKPSMG